MEKTGTKNARPHAEHSHAERPGRLKELVRKLYITMGSFIENNLFTSASAGAYSFLLSALPILLLVLAILIRFLHESPETITSLLQTYVPFFDTFDLNSIIASITSIKSIGLFEIILGLSVFWMARRLFASFQQGLNIIYRKRGRSKPIKENLLVIAAEVFLVVLIVIFTAGGIAGNAFFRTMISKELLNPFIFTLYKNLFRFAPTGIIFIFLTLVYWLAPRIRPKFGQSVLSALACTLSYSALQIVFTTFVNISRYNLVYGILSRVIVLLLEVYFFFVIFFFYAQYLYVTHFYESFLITQLYCMPGQADTNPLKKLERDLFLEPSLFYRKYAVTVPKDTVIFKKGESSADIYYIWSGTVMLGTHSSAQELGKGQVFGELASLIGGRRTSQARALTGCVLLKIPEAIFQETIEVDIKLARRTLEIISDYVHNTSQHSEQEDSGRLPAGRAFRSNDEAAGSGNIISPAIPDAENNQ